MASYTRRSFLRNSAAVAGAVAGAGALTDLAELGRVEAAATVRSNVTLTMWTWKVFHVKAWQEVAKAFKAKTGISVTIQAYQPDALYRTKLAAAGASKALPDIISYWSTDWAPAANGWWMDLTGKVDGSAYMPGTFDTGSVVTKPYYTGWAADPTNNKAKLGLKVGHAYSLPALAGAPNFMFFNKAMRKKAGLNPDVPPATFEALISDLKAIKTAGEPGFAAGVKNPGVPVSWVTAASYVQYVGPQAYEDQFTGWAPLNNPKFVHMLELVKELATDRLWVPGITEIDIDPADSYFASGRSSLDVGGTYSHAAILQLGMVPDNVLTFNVPGPQGSVVKKFINAAFSLIDMGINPATQHPDEALAWLKYSTGREGAAIFAKTAGDLPAAQLPADPKVVGAGVASLLSFFPKLPKGVKGTFTSVKDSWLPGGVVGSPESLYENDMQALVLGQGDPASVAKSVQSALDGYDKKTYPKTGKPPRYMVS
jgi:ABC-type glycerol-3-phosphate transport system substrate-binding protein